MKQCNTDEELAYQDEHFRNLDEYRKKYILDEEISYFGCLTHHSGLRNKSKALKIYISQKDFIEAGAYIGAATLVYSKIYNARRVYSFDISAKTRKRYKRIMELNDMPKDKWRLIDMGLSNRKKSICIVDSGSMETSVNEFGDSNVSLVDLDSFVRDINEKLDIGFIVSDVEGAGLHALHGMYNTIRQYRPVLSLSIYHNPVEFFEIKPALESIVNDLNYKIIIEKLNCLMPQIMTPIVFAYPKELDD
jgi:FkbM family methyltransferase